MSGIAFKGAGLLDILGQNADFQLEPNHGRATGFIGGIASGVEALAGGLEHGLDVGFEAQHKPRGLEAGQ